ncbi:beta-1,3-galactosyltransferase brn-like [Argopecten irradians]
MNNISLVILVKSAVSNAHLRKSIRITWGNTTEYKNVRIVFMLGYNASTQGAVDTEAKIYGDIVQESFIDAYMNNTYKTIMTFNWAVEHCSHATHFVFIDDDLYLILPNLFNYIIMHRENKTPDMVGHLNVNAKVVRQITKKWFISEEEYPFMYWPPYLSGGIFMVAPNVAKRFVFSFPYVKYMGIDDCYLGIVAYKWGIKVSDEKKLNLLHHDVFKDPDQIAYHDFKSEDAFKKVWNYLRKSHEKKVSKNNKMRSRNRFVRKPGFGSNAF